MWTEQKEGITMPHFVLLISNFAQHEPKERIDLMNGAIKLFQEIDINGDGRVEWGEFVQFVTDQVTTVRNRRPDEGIGAVCPGYLIEMVKQIKLGEFNKFKLRESNTDKTSHRRAIRYVLYNAGPSFTKI